MGYDLEKTKLFYRLKSEILLHSALFTLLSIRPENTRFETEMKECPQVEPVRIKSIFSKEFKWSYKLSLWSSFSSRLDMIFLYGSDISKGKKCFKLAKNIVI